MQAEARQGSCSRLTPWVTSGVGLPIWLLFFLIGTSTRGFQSSACLPAAASERCKSLEVISSQPYGSGQGWNSSVRWVATIWPSVLIICFPLQNAGRRPRARGIVPNPLLQGAHHVAPILWASSSPLRKNVVVGRYHSDKWSVISLYQVPSQHRSVFLWGKVVADPLPVHNGTACLPPTPSVNPLSCVEGKSLVPHSKDFTSLR